MGADAGHAVQLVAVGPTQLAQEASQARQTNAPSAYVPVGQS